MKLIILKGGDDAVPHGHAWRRQAEPSRSAGALALSGDAAQSQWVLINVSPSVVHQLNTDARLLRHRGLADASARAVVLTDARVDHVTGLLSLRDGAPIHLYATPAVFEELTHSLPVLPVLQHYCGVHWHVIPVAGECRESVFRVEGQPTLEFTALATDGPVPPHASRAAAPATGETIALAVRDLVTGQRVFLVSGLSQAGPEATAWMQEADCLVVGDTPESPRPGRMAEVDAPAEIDVLGLMQGIHARRKVLMCRPEQQAPACAQVQRLEQCGVEVAADRMEIEL
ncbi:pyrroloquinoline quinone biosynthesis protein B [Sphaerotilus hippei]|uniref:Pyrroloquinoline quinone biosynthesis protein B n=1 Tax=Sphaerotilus hippei TaxID=744406 RepID=A0A318H9Q1_9BURK|nr:MBL fold metallo-hydrolase [Sphaerotilus hippei]PXW98798.1 pyrroloquinoline quinone biosynthesis protein B [Sphaerotilus hippei]